MKNMFTKLASFLIMHVVIKSENIFVVLYYTNEISSYFLFLLTFDKNGCQGILLVICQYTLIKYKASVQISVV